jgi:hypothetical protein
LNLHEFFNFGSKEPRLKRWQMLPFYAFAGKLNTIQERVAERIHFSAAMRGQPHRAVGIFPHFVGRTGLRARVRRFSLLCAGLSRSGTEIEA